MGVKNFLNRVLRREGDALTANAVATKDFTIIDDAGNDLFGEPITAMRLLALAPLLKQAFTLRLNALLSINVETNWPFGSFSTFLEAMEYDRLVYGQAFALRLTDKQARWIDYQMLDPTTILIKHYGPQHDQYNFEQYDAKKLVRRWPPGAICHIADIGEENEPVSSLQAAAPYAIVLYLAESVVPSQLGLNGIPPRVMEVHGLLPQDRQDFIRRLKIIVRRPQRSADIVGTEAEIKVHDLMPSIDDLGIDKMAEMAKDAIAYAFGIPPAMLRRDIANYATAREFRSSFWEDSIIPLARRYEAALNEWGQGYGITFDFDLDNIPTLIEKRADLANSLSNALVSYVTAGVPVDVAADTLGLHDLAETLSALFAGNKPARDDKLLTIDNTSPTIAGNVDEAQQTELTVASMEGGADNNAPPPQGEKATFKTALKTDLYRWRKKAIKRARKNLLAKPVLFQSDVIPAAYQVAIEAAFKDIVSLPTSEQQIAAINDTFAGVFAAIDNDALFESHAFPEAHER